MLGNIVILPRDSVPMPRYCVIVIEAGIVSIGIIHLAYRTQIYALLVLPSIRACHCMCRTTPSVPCICCQNWRCVSKICCNGFLKTYDIYHWTEVRRNLRQDAGSICYAAFQQQLDHSASSELTEICFSIAQDWLVPSAVEIIKYYVWMCDLDICLQRQGQQT